MAVQDRQMSEGPCGVCCSRSATQEVAAPANPPSCAVAPPLPSAVNSTSRLSTAVRSVSGSQSDNGDASQLSFYTPTVRDIIEHAKQFFHCDLVSINLFPLRPQFNTKAGEYINEAITERRSRGLVIPEGERNLLW
jgi:hypothetical protein